MSAGRGAGTLPASDVKKFKCVFLGDHESGKSSIIQRAIDDTFPKRYLATVGVDFVSKTMKLEPEEEKSGEEAPKKSVRLQLWDTAGQERFKASIPSYIRDSHIAVITFDISNRSQFDNIEKWIEEVRQIRGQDVIIWLVATKVDVPLYDRKVSWLEMEQAALKQNLEFMEVSAKAGYNIRELFLEMTQKLPHVQAETKLQTHSARF